jgi:hypothetical protein
MFGEIIVAALTLVVFVFALEKTFAGRKTPIDFILGPLRAGDQVTLLLIGNSHTGALRTVALRDDDVTYNASVGGQDLCRSYLLLRAYLPRLPRLREVVVAADYDAVGYNLSVFNQEWQDRQYYPYTGELYHDGSLQRLLAKSSFFRNNRDLSVVFSHAQPNTRDSNPILPADGRVASTPEGCGKRAKEHSEVKFRRSLIVENIDYLQRIVALGLRQNVTIHFLNTPKSDCYRTNYSEATRRIGREAILRALGPRGDEFHDYFDDGRFLGEDFLDDDHLSLLGAQKLMKDLGSRTAPPAGGIL